VTVGQVRTDANWGTVRIAIDVQESTECLQSQIRRGKLAVRTGLSEGRYGSENDPRVDLRQRCVAEPKPLQSPGLKGLQDEVRRLDQATEDGVLVGIFEVQNDAALTQVRGPPRQAALAVRTVGIERRPPARWIPRDGSILMTSAPRSARMRPANSPNSFVRSRTR
jgi:hypothetical protein